MQKIRNNLLKIFLVFCFFVSPLIFLTDFTRNPYILQNVILVFSALAALFLLLLEVYKQKNFYFSFADFAFLIFAGFALLSLIINALTSANAAVFFNEFLRRGDILITNMLCGYFLARLIFNKQTSYTAPHKQEETNYKAGFLLLLWGLLWLPFDYFRMKGLFDIYALLMWCSGCYIALKILKEINIKNILDLMLPVCALACAYGICQNLDFDFLWPLDISKEFGKRSISTFGNPNFLSAFILLAGPFGLINLLKAKTKFEKFYYFFICLLYTTALTLTQARSSWLGAVLALIVLFCFKDFRNLIKQNKKIFISFALISCSLFLLWPKGDGGKYQSLVLQRSVQDSFIKSADLTLAVKVESINQSYHQRLLMWACGIDNFKQKPLLGWGWGSWQMSFASCQGKILKKYPALSDLKTQANSAHNIFIETLAQSGILGFCAYLVFLVLLLLSFKKYYARQTGPSNKLFAVTILSSVLAFLADNMLNITAFITVLSFAFYFFAGVLASLDVKNKKISKNFILICLILTAVFFVFFNYQNYKNTRSSVYSFKAYKEVSKHKYYPAKNLLDKAISLSANSAEDYYLQLHTLLQINDFNGLENLLKKSLKYFPYFYEFNYHRAALEERKGNFKDAFKYLKQTLNLYPYYEPALKAFLNLLYTDGSLRTLEQAKFIEGFSLPLSYRNAYNVLLAKIYFENGNYQKAKDILLQELALNKFDITVQENLNMVNKKLGIKEDLLLKEAQNLTALRRQVLSSNQVSAALFKQLKEQAKSGDLDGQMLLAQAYFKNKEYAKSREILKNLYANYPNSLPLNFAYASLEEEQGNTSEAKKYLQAVLSLDKNNELALRRLENLK